MFRIVAQCTIIISRSGTYFCTWARGKFSTWARDFNLGKVHIYYLLWGNMGLDRKPGYTLPDKEKEKKSISLGSLNPFITEADNILVSKCCRADALYRISEKYGYDIWEFCPQCLELCDWDEIKEEKEDKHLFDDMSEYYSEHGLPAKVNEVSRDQNFSYYDEIIKLIEWTEDDKSDGYYNGEDEELTPWQFSLSDFQHPDREIDLLVKLWNGELEGVISGKIGEGFIYYFEADALIYEVVISENMGLDSMSIVAESEQ
jgi:hypothetical protein